MTATAHNKRPTEAQFPLALSKFVYPMHLAGFRRLRLRRKPLEAPSHFCGFGSANALTLTSCQEYLIRWDMIAGMSPCVFTSSLRNSAVSVAAFRASFRCFGDHRCGLAVREQAKSKVVSTKPTSFYACLHGRIIPKKEEKYNISRVNKL